MRVAFLSEGATELAFASGARGDEGWRHGFLLKTLVERMLGVPRLIEPLQDEALPFLRGNPAGKLCRHAARLARACVRFGAEGIVVVVDRDRTPARERWRALVEQRERLRSDRQRPLLVPMAVGVAVETIEAWLLADEVAVCDALGVAHPDQPIGSPERLDGPAGTAAHPKAVLGTYLARDAVEGRGFLEQVVAIVEAADLDTIARRCPQGFARFREDVVRESGPAIGG